MPKSVDLARLAELLPGYGYAFLVTVGADHRARTTAVTPTYDGATLDIGPVGRHGRANLGNHRNVTLVFPARAVDEYSLIIEGEADLPDDPDAPVRIRPAKALLHRPVLREGTGQAEGVVHDCVQLT